MSGITGVSASTSSLLQLLTQPQDGQSDPSLLATLLADQSQSVTPATQTAAPGTGTTATSSLTDLENQIRSAVSAALQSAEQGSGATDLKSVVYNALSQVLKDNGIDPKTLQKTASAGQSGTAGTPSQAVDPGTSSVLAQVMTALSGVGATSDPLAQLMPSQQSSQGSSDLLSMLSTSQTSQDDSQGSSDLFSALSTSQTSQNGNAGSGDLVSQFLASQNNNQDLLGFLFDSGQ